MRHSHAVSHHLLSGSLSRRSGAITFRHDGLDTAARSHPGSSEDGGDAGKSRGRLEPVASGIIICAGPGAAGGRGAGGQGDGHERSVGW